MNWKPVYLITVVPWEQLIDIVKVAKYSEVAPRFFKEGTVKEMTGASCPPKMSKRPWFFLRGDPFRNSHRIGRLECTCNGPQGQWVGSFLNFGCWQTTRFIFYFLELKILLRTHWPNIIYKLLEKEVCNMSLSTDRPYKKGPYLRYFHFVEKDKITICLKFWSVGCLCISTLAKLKS